MNTFRINQSQLVSAIMTELGRQCPNLPADDRVNTIIKAANDIVAEYARKRVMATYGMGLAAWLASDDTGASSRFMAYTLASNDQRQMNFRGKEIPQPAHPRDADDFGRCVRMIDAWPEFASRIEEMDAAGPFWQIVVSNWNAWRGLYSSGRVEALNHEMQQAYAKAWEGKF